MKLVRAIQQSTGEMCVFASEYLQCTIWFGDTGEPLNFFSEEPVELCREHWRADDWEQIGEILECKDETD